VVATDVCVPISRLADCVTETEEDLKRLNLMSPIVGHVGDGNFHCSLLCDVDDADEMARGEDFMHRLVERAQCGWGGTCTGEHGIGQGKQKIPWKPNSGRRRSTPMRALKRALDPQNIFQSPERSCRRCRVYFDSASASPSVQRWPIRGLHPAFSRIDDCNWTPAIYACRHSGAWPMWRFNQGKRTGNLGRRNPVAARRHRGGPQDTRHLPLGGRHAEKVAGFAGRPDNKRTNTKSNGTSAPPRPPWKSPSRFPMTCYAIPPCARS